MAVGAVAVASPTGVNSEIITDGKDGFLATSEDEWVEKIGTLITQAQLRQQIAQAGLSRIETHYSETAVLPQLVKTIQQTAQLAHRHE
jgi:glycosyltransferase involved in cell wall biosynthesis